MQVKSKVKDVMKRDVSVLHLLVILPNSTRIKCRLPESSTTKVEYIITVSWHQFHLYADSV